MLKVGEVVETKMAYKSNQKDDDGNILPHGTIQVRLGDITLMTQVRNEYASPALYNKRIPLIGEKVLIITAPKNESSTTKWKRIGYLYLTCYNTIDDVVTGHFPYHWQRDPSSPPPNPGADRLADKKELGYTFKKNPPGNKFLQPFEGDDLWEGRHGQSIRLGRSYDTVNSPGIGIYEKQATWKGGKNHDPILIIKVKKPESGDGYDIEDISKDEASIYLTTSQKIPNFKPGFNKNTDVKQLSNKSGPIAFINSETVVLNSTKEKIYLIGKKETVTTAEKVLMQSRKYKVDLDDLMDYINELTKYFWQLCSSQAVLLTMSGPTATSTHVTQVTKLHNVDFNKKFKMP